MIDITGISVGYILKVEFTFLPRFSPVLDLFRPTDIDWVFENAFDELSIH